MLCIPTAYAVAKGAEVADGSRNKMDKGRSKWWLRSPGYSFQNASVASRSRMSELRSAFFTQKDICVRPAIWVDMDSDLFAWNH